MNIPNDKEIRLKLLKLIENSPNITQRGMNRSMGISLGKVNYCMTELVKKGLIKVERPGSQTGVKKDKKITRY